MFLHKPETENDEDSAAQIAELVIAKHRSGSTGRVKLMWQPSYTTFMSVDNTFD